jgi:hypothetical protein
MKTLLVTAMLLVSCATPRSLDKVPKKKDPEISENALFELKNELKTDIRRLDYYIDHERCFTVYAICLGEQKKPRKECWNQHESCVIRVYHQYKGKK